MSSLRPIIIVGAPRSGTNVLRDVLTASPRLTTWPCDEINYIWRHGNRGAPTDELTPAHADPKVRRYIRSAFEAQARRGGTSNVVEKTCASTLRVPFIHAVLPDATYIHITRDPVDAVASAMKRWRAPLETSYLREKLRWVPPSDLPYYMGRYASHRIRKIRSEDGRLPTWGPRFAGIDELAQDAPLHVVCAMQWARCHGESARALDELASSKVHRVGYEELARSPDDVLTNLTVQLLGAPDAVVVEAGGRLNVRSVGQGRRELTEAEVQEVVAIAQQV